MHNKLRECDSHWGDHERAQAKHPEYLHFLTALSAAVGAGDLVETFISTVTGDGQSGSSILRITMLTKNAWILADFPGESTPEAIKVLPRSRIERISLVTQVPEDFYHFEEVYGFSVVLDGERLHFDSNAQTRLGGSVPNLLTHALSDLAKR